MSEPETAFQEIFYTLPAPKLEEGMSTDDGQDILDVDDDGEKWVWVRVYTPRSDDPELDAENRCEPETRGYERDRRVDLAVFSDTPVNGSEYPDAEKVPTPSS